MSEFLQRILVVDDQAEQRRVLSTALEAAGFEVLVASGGDEALALISEVGLPHLALIDIMMPGMSGIELSRLLLQSSDVPIILLTAVAEQETIVGSLNEIAEDYIKKPFDPEEVVARVRRVIRRMGDYSYALAPVTVIDDYLSVDLARQMVFVEGEERSLTPTETKIMHILVRSAGRIVTAGFLLRRVWPLEDVFEDSLRVHVHRLRRKIEPDPAKPRYLFTRRGTGYEFVRASTD